MNKPTQQLTNEQVDEMVKERGEAFEAINEMISAGISSGLLVELIWSFGQARKGGDDVPTAVGFACREWDV